MSDARQLIFRPTEAETVRLIESTGIAIELVFGPSGAWFAWAEGEREPEAVTLVKKWRGLPLVGTDGDGI